LIYKREKKKKKGELLVSIDWIEKKSMIIALIFYWISSPEKKIPTNASIYFLI
jgi:hypothetical protein